MKKSRLLCGVIASMSLGAIATSSGSIQAVHALEPDTRVIVKLTKDVKDLTSEEVKQSQEALLSRIRYSVNPNVELINSFSVLNNAMTLSVNKEDVEAIGKLSGVEKVYQDKVHVKKATSQGITFKVNKEANSEIDQNENVSARTMRKPGYDDGTGNILPGDTNDGEGTLIAILDNEFYFQGATKTEPEWHHEVFEPLPEGTAERIHAGDYFDENDPMKQIKYAALNAVKNEATSSGLKKKNADAGKEGSLYFNSKVPFYYDYGGHSETYSGDPIQDFDVHSTIDYHGSHVASITGANAPEYKGIAPLCQLACMKVFTDYQADAIAKDIGFGDSGGAYDSCILQALEDCIILGVDGINMSLGSDLAEFEDDDLAMQTIERMVKEEKILTSISNGNGGKESYNFIGGYGNWTKELVETGLLGSYANNPTSMSIGSAHPDYIYYKTGLRCGDTNVAYDDQIVNTERYPSEYQTEYRMKDIENASYYCSQHHSYHTKNDIIVEKIDGVEHYYCKDYPDVELEKEVAPNEWVYVPGFGSSSDYKNLKVEGKIAVVNRGSTSFADKYNVAAEKGAAGLLIINNDPTETDFTFRCSFGDDFNPSMPCAMILFKDKPYFERERSGEFTFMEKELSKDSDARTMSTFSTDGARSDLDIKPEITAPGDIIRGAVPPQTKEDKTETPLTTYEYLSGTSMSAPNYAGAQAVVLSKVTKDLVKDGVSDADLEVIKAEREKVNMRLMSTANPMYLNEGNPESGDVTYASPRVQGAGMADIYGALNSKVYLEGLNDQGEGIGKAKVELHNNADINRGDIKISFKAHNESDKALEYNVKLTIMRPATAENNKIVTSDYNYMGEVDSFEKLPGIRYYDPSYKKVVYTQGTASHKDCYKVSKQLTYYTSQSDYDHKTNPVTMDTGYWFVSSNVQNAQEGVVYDVLPNHEYLSTKDMVLDVVEGQKVTIQPGESTIKINDYSLSSEMKKKILETYEYGTYIEGFVELIATGFEEDLAMPFLGFYGGGDLKEGQDYNSAPVVEPFQFEKEVGQVYPSDLVNDLTKQLVGKDNVNFASMWLAGYAERPELVDTDQIIKNDRNFAQLNEFHYVGTDPMTGETDEDAGNNIYVGNASQTNTMIIQQFILRSVRDNFFEIKDQAGNVVYRSAMEDAIFGDTYGTYALHKSMVASSYLGGGYVADRALAVVPLYDETTRKPFADGDYTITFNYQLNGTGKWVNKSYNLHIDNTPPEVTNIYEKDGKVRIEMKDVALSYVTVGYTNLSVQYDDVKKIYYVDVEKDFIKQSMEEIGRTQDDQYRLYISPVDKAFGSCGAIVHFNEEGNYDDYTIVQNKNLKVTNDFKIDENGAFVFIEIDEYGRETVVDIDSIISIGVRGVDKSTSAGGVALSLGLTVGVIAVAFSAVMIAIIKMTAKRKRK